MELGRFSLVTRLAPPRPAKSPALGFVSVLSALSALFVLPFFSVLLITRAGPQGRVRRRVARRGHPTQCVAVGRAHAEDTGGVRGGGDVDGHAGTALYDQYEYVSCHSICDHDTLHCAQERYYIDIYIYILARDCSTLGKCLG